MKYTKGFTLIELMIVLAIIAILASVVVRGIYSTSSSNSSLLDNMTNGRIVCKGGYQYNVDTNGYQQQVISEQGGGVRCQ